MKVKIGKDGTKASFIFKSNVHHEFEKRSYIFKIDNIVFAIYKHSPHPVNMTGLKNTHDWNYDKPYEWGLETLTETTFIKNL